MKETKTQRLVVSAMLLALGTAISFVSEQIPFLNLPFGGVAYDPDTGLLTDCKRAK